MNIEKREQPNAVLLSRSLMASRKRVRVRPGVVVWKRWAYLSPISGLWPRSGCAVMFGVAGVGMWCVVRGARFVRRAAATTPAHGVRTAGAFPPLT